jgi:glycosyltransferase involved in cell wall biosynthesis
VGAFPPPERKIFGGHVTSCRALLASSFVHRFDLILVDSTQASNPPPGVIVRSMLALKRFALFIRKLSARRPQAVILFTAVGASVLEKGMMAWACRFFAIPALIFPRGAEIIDTASNSSFHRFWIATSLRGATHFLCQGPAWQRFATEALNFPLERAPIIPNWTATNCLLAIGERRASRKLPQVPQMLFLGWLEREKGIFELLEACQALFPLYPFRLVIAGRGHAESAARALVEGSKLASMVEFAGWVQGETLDALFASSDILILPSWAEGFPNAIIEAMAAKLAVVVSAVGNVPDLIVDGREALLVPPKEADPLRRAIERLLVDKNFRLELAERGHAFARDNFSVEMSVNKLTTAIVFAIEEQLVRRKI